ncbi:MAG: hypothetical protein RLZZ70_771 [Candidatus Parcubacteria bacterium]|jgi:hypothetical protein
MSKTKIKGVIGGIFFLVGLVFIASACFTVLEQSRWFKQAVVTTAEVTSMTPVQNQRDQALMYQTTLTYSVGSTSYVLIDPVTSSYKRFDLGEVVEITFIPTNPSDARIIGGLFGWFLPGIFGFMGSIFTFLGGLFLWGYTRTQNIIRQGVSIIAEKYDIEHVVNEYRIVALYTHNANTYTTQPISLSSSEYLHFSKVDTVVVKHMSPGRAVVDVKASIGQ